MPASTAVASTSTALVTARVTVVVNGNYATVGKGCIGASAVSGVVASVGGGAVRTNRSTVSGD